MKVKEIRSITIGMAVALLLILLMSTDAAFAEDGNDGIDLIGQPSIPVIVFHIDESQGTIENMNADENHNATCSGTMDIIVPEGFGGYVDMNTVPQTIKGIPLDYIRGRGNSTWRLPKKPYKIKLAKAAEGVDPVDLFGMGTNRHWVLLANAMDPTIIKNRITLKLGEQLGFAFTPQCVPVDVIMKSDTDPEHNVYLGSYYLAEQVRVDSDRLNIRKLEEKDTEPDEITGGYLIKGGQQTDENSPDYFTTDRGIMLANDTPSFDPVEGYENDAQKAYIRGHIQDVEDAVFGTDFRNSNGERYTDLMDMKSAADYWLVQQATANCDAYLTGSTYFYKVSDTFDVDGNTTAAGKFYWGPVWDFDIAYGEGQANTAGFDYANSWITAMMYDKNENGFRAMVKEEWPTIRNTLLTMAEDDNLIDQYRNELRVSRNQDYALWKETIPYYYADRYSDYDENIKKLKEWIIARVGWMDQYFSSEEFEEEVCKVTYVVDGETARLEYYPRHGYINMFIPDKDEEAYQPEKEGCIFLGWENESGSLVTAHEQILGDKVFTARFVKEEEATLADEIVFRMDEECCNLNDAYVKSQYLILPRDAQDKSVTWGSSDTNIAKVDGSGKVTLLAPGTVTITATLKSGATGSYELTIVSGAHPSLESIALEPEEMMLNVGEYAKLNATVRPKTARFNYIAFLSDDEEIASVDYATGLVTGLKTGTTSIHMIASYKKENDSISVDKCCKVTVVKKRLSIKKAKVTGIIDKTWTGKALKQKQNVALGGLILKSGIDYTVSYKSNKNVGKATVTIKGRGDYTGKITKTFKINPKGTTIKKPKKARKAIKVKWKKQAAKMSASRITGYQILLATDKKFKKNKKTVNVKGYKKTSKKVRKLKKKTRYYVKVRTYKVVNGTKYYSPWSKVKTVKTR